ncbi:MAG: helix-turn-helix domain-containing protein [Brevundimonas aurantiaca]|uniref:helix-turn-helix domain-containing protein n=1 Tax=Brevundimonas aurantiaca TaxID=74316 RepID=UPI004033CCF5
MAAQDDFGLPVGRVDVPAQKREKLPDPYDVALGQRVSSARLGAGLSQGALAKAIGVAYQQLQKYERGENRLSVARLKRISNALAVPMNVLLGEREDPTSDALRVDPRVLRTALLLHSLPKANQRAIEALVALMDPSAVATAA